MRRSPQVFERMCGERVVSAACTAAFVGALTAAKRWTAALDAFEVARRVQEEHSRVQEEHSRVQGESRVEGEQSRVQEEQSRVEGEQSRVQEHSRVEGEQSRGGAAAGGQGVGAAGEPLHDATADTKLYTNLIAAAGRAGQVGHKWVRE